jgi:hypothetical protein
MDLDQSGQGFQRVRTYLGPSLGWKDELVSPSTHITIGGAHTVLPGESLLLVDVAAPVTIFLPDVVKWFQQTDDRPATSFERSIVIKDFGGNAANFNIIVTPFGQQFIDNVQSSLVISTARSAVKLIPLVDLTGWAVALASASGGGGGGGDVFKAGNNTFTGSNTFNGPITVPTVASNDNSQNAASTAWIVSQAYITSVSLAPYATINSPVLTGDPKAPTPSPGDNDTSIATTAFVQSAIASYAQPLDADLTSLAAASGIGTMYYRSAANTWTPVTIGGGITFSGGVLGSSAGGGNVSSAGTPTNGQLAQWTSSTQIQGIAVSSLGFAPIANPVFTGDPQAPTPAAADNDTSIATTAFVKTVAQPLDGDLTAIAALTGTNTIYYRSAPDIWSPVSFSGLSFSGGILTVTAGGGNVNNTGTPTAGQVAEWTDATHIQGVSTYAKLASPVFTGDPQAPTPAPGDNDTSIATTAFVQAVLTAAITPPQGRLTLQNTIPVMISTVTSSANLFYIPYVGNLIPIYNGTKFIMTPFSALTALLSDTTKNPAAIGNNKVNDWFVWNDGGVIRLGHATDWTNTTTRSAGTALAMVNGILTNNLAITNGPAANRGTYVGTTISNGTATIDWIYGATGSPPTAAFFGLWNCYNRVKVSNQFGDNSGSWSYGGTSPEFVNVTGKVVANYVSGLAEDTFTAMYTSCSQPASGGVAVIGIGYDTVAFVGLAAYGSGVAGGFSTNTGIFSSTSVGLHNMAALEASNSAGQVQNFYGSTLGGQVTGLYFEGRF